MARKEGAKSIEFYLHLGLGELDRHGKMVRAGLWSLLSCYYAFCVAGTLLFPTRS